MIVIADGVPRGAYAVRDARTKRIVLASICETEDEAHRLLAAMRVHQAHQMPCEIMPVVVSVTASADITERHNEVMA